jgi:hypothetical protein
MEDERTTESAPAPSPPSEGERADAEDTSPQDAPADPAADSDTDAEAETDGEGATDATEHPSADPAPPARATDELPRTTTTGDDEQDVRSAGDGAVSGPPGDDLDDPAQRHD